PIGGWVGRPRYAEALSQVPKGIPRSDPHDAPRGIERCPSKVSIALIDDDGRRHRSSGGSISPLSRVIRGTFERPENTFGGSPSTQRRIAFERSIDDARRIV